MIAAALFAFVALLASAQAQCPGSGGQLIDGQCWYIAGQTQGCDTVCTSNSATADLAKLIEVGSGAADTTACQAIIDGFGFQATVVDVSGGDCNSLGLGCFYNIGQSLRCTSPTTTVAAANPNVGGGRFCACDGDSSSGGQDPHFHGLNGENVDIVRDAFSNNKIFSIYCDAKTIINAKFSANPDALLFMTEFYGRFGDVAFELKLGKHPQLYGVYITEDISQNRTRFTTPEGTIESDGTMMIAKFPQVKIMISTAIDVAGNVYFDIDLFPGENTLTDGRRASGIVGRTFERVYTEEEFAEYHHFLVKSDPFNTCGGSAEFSY